MGYALDSLHWMQALLADEPPALFALNTLTQTYRIVAFVLHDPDVDTDFHQVIQARFAALHRITGRRVLFFVAGLDKQVNKSKMEDVRRVTDELAQQYSSTAARQQPGNGVPLVAEALGLSSRLPAIVLVDSTAGEPLRNQWLWMPTNAQDIWWHLEQLTAYEDAQHEAKRGGRQEGRGPHIQRFAHNALPLELRSRENEVRFSGKYLAAASRSGSQRLRQLSSVLVNDLVDVGRRVGEAAEAARETREELPVQLLNQAAHEINTKLRVLTSAHLSPLPFLDADINHESRVNVVSAWYSKQALDQWAPTLAADAAAFGLSLTDTPSYTGPVVELGSAVEREMVLSAGQALRAYVDIPVHLAFNRFYRTSPIQDFTLPGTKKRRPLDLNVPQRGSDLWLPPTIGALRAAFQEVAAPEGKLLNWPANLSVEEFIEEWKVMSTIRNDAAHANRSITGGDFDLLLEKMNHLKTRGELDWMISTKRHLQDPMFTKAQLWRS